VPALLTHLRIALEIATEDSAFEPYHFAVGSLAPDCGVRLPDRGYDPPKSQTHFKQAGASPFVLGDLLFYRRYLMSAPILSLDEYSFLSGYFCHLLTDNLWFLRFGKQFAKDRQAAVDASFLQKHPDFQLPPDLPLRVPAAIAAFLPAQLVACKLQETRSLVPIAAPLPSTPADAEQVSHFVRAARQVFYRTLDRLHHAPAPSAEHISALAAFLELAAFTQPDP
jgi:hypothetical protein